MNDVRYVLTFPGGDEIKTEKLIAHVKAELESHHLTVCADKELADQDKWDGEPRFILVTADLDLIEKEAESLKIHQLTKKKVNNHPDIQVFETHDGSRSSLESFTPAERCDILWDMISTVEMTDKTHKYMEGCSNYKYAKEARSLILGLKMATLIEICFPMHEDGQKKEIWSKAYKQLLTPVKEINEYFGSEIAFYFAWMNYSTKWYIFPGVFGLGVYLYGQFSEHSVDDNPYIPLFSLFVVIWAVLFMKYWRRNQYRWAYSFSTVCDEESEIERAEFEGTMILSEITGKKERVYPYQKRMVSYGVSALVTFAMLCVAFGVMCCSLNLQGYIKDDTSYERAFYIEPIARYAEPGAIFDPNGTSLIMTLIPTILHVVTIMQLNNLYRMVAEWLTDGENHRTEHEHENALIIKRIFFEAFDCYIALFYIAFFQFDVSRLRVELVQMYTTDSIRRVGVEAILPIILGAASRVARRKKILTPLRSMRKEFTRRDLAKLSTTDIDAELEMAEYEQFDDYLEMVIQFGYVTLFASAFPLASALSVVCNLVEMKSDLFKLVWVYQRPHAHRASNIGTWENVMMVMSALAVLTNCMIFTFSSEQMMQWLPFMFVEDETGEQDFAPGWARIGYTLCFTLEHLLFVVVAIIFFLIPDKPTWVTIKLKKLKHNQEQLAHKARVEERAKVKGKVKGLIANLKTNSEKRKDSTFAVKSPPAAMKMKIEDKKDIDSAEELVPQPVPQNKDSAPIVSQEEGDGFEVIENPRQRRKKKGRTGAKTVLDALT